MTVSEGLRERDDRGRHFSKTIKSKGNFFQHHVRKFCDGIVIFKVIKKPLQKRLSQVIRKVVIQTLFEKPGREEHALKKWQLLDEDIMQDCPSENAPSRNILSFLKQANPPQLIILVSDFIFITVSLRVLKHLRKIMKNVSLSFIKSSISVLDLNSSSQLRLTVCVCVCVWQFEIGSFSERVFQFVTFCLFC